MKITKWITVETEVELTLCTEDIAAAIATDPDSASQIRQGLSNAIRFMRAIPDEAIIRMTIPLADMTATLLMEQAKRFNPKVGDKP